MVQDFYPPMFHSILSLLLLSSLLVFHVEAQSFGGSSDYESDEQSQYQPGVRMVIGVLSIMFALTFTLLVYAKYCHRRASVSNARNNHLGTGLVTASSRFSGIDKTVIEALPFFRFSSLKGSKQGFECSVCLSKFEDIEILRLLPKCKHAFHINCIDHWLEKHSSCPLCRHRVSSEDLNFLTYSNSMRVLWNEQSENRQDSNIEIFVEREEDNHHRGSSRFSFRKSEKAVDKEEELLIQQDEQSADVAKDNQNEDQKILHKHKIVVSDFEFKNRWSNVSSSDLMFLSSEMLNTMSSSRFSSGHLNNNESLSPVKAAGNEEIVKIREELEMKRLFENKVSNMNKNNSSQNPIPPSTSDRIETTAQASRSMNQGGEKRSMSEMTGLSRFGNLGFKNKARDSSRVEENVQKERMRRLWFPIARRTVQWFANREKRPHHQQPLDHV